jgi:imidazoleglycerol-phosphate dehydratase
MVMKPKKRTAEIRRETRETRVSIDLLLDGKGQSQIATGVGFLDHMLTLLARHALMDLTIEAEGDREVDDHHSVEDVGICLGQALRQALGDKKGIRRFGSEAVPMDEALAEVALDLSGRGMLVYRVPALPEKVGSFDTSLFREFLQGFVAQAEITLHVNVPYAEDGHHCAEAIFKGLARALRSAVEIDRRERGVPSTKGVL